MHQMQEQKLDLSTNYREAIEETGAFSIYPPGIEKLLRLCYEKKLKELDRQLAIEEVSSQLFKTIFGEEKNTDMNAIKHATQPTIQSTY